MACTYSLTIRTDPEGRAKLSETGSSIVIARPVGARRPNLAWIVLPPLAAIWIKWTDTYGLFASETPLRADAIIEPRHTVYPAAHRHLYSYGDYGFGPPQTDDRLPPGQYDVRNECERIAVFGLLQSATVNATSFRRPLNAVALAPNCRANFATAHCAYVWVEAHVVAGSVVVDIPNTALKMRFNARNRLRACDYDSENRRFAITQPPLVSGVSDS